jgi:uncharacterized protein YerC
MTNLICPLAWVAVLITLPLVLLFKSTESKAFRVRRLRRQGLTWKSIASQLGVSQTTARRWAAA